MKSLCNVHKWIYFGGECRCRNCYAELFPGGKIKPYTGKGKPHMISKIEKVEKVVKKVLAKKAGSTASKGRTKARV